MILKPTDGRVIKIIVITVSCLMLHIATSTAAELKVRISNIDVKRGGNIIVMIFNENGFPIEHEKAILKQTRNAHQDVMHFIFDLDTDELAVKVLHDENADNQVTKNWTGIYPKEGLGFSNDQQISLTGPPQYNKSMLIKDQFKNGINISITYP